MKGVGRVENPPPFYEDTMTNRTEALIAELSDALETVFPVGCDNVANLDTTSGRTLTVMTAEAYEKLLADALAWRAVTRGQPETMGVDEVIAMFGKPQS